MSSDGFAVQSAGMGRNFRRDKKKFPQNKLPPAASGSAAAFRLIMRFRLVSVTKKMLENNGFLITVIPYQIGNSDFSYFFNAEIHKFQFIWMNQLGRERDSDSAV